MNKINDYFCSVPCYTKFRLGLGIDYSKIVCRYPRIPPLIREQKYVKPEGIGQIDYTKFNYCRACKIKIPKTPYKVVVRCPDCNRKIRQKPQNKLRYMISQFGEDTRTRIQ